MRMTSIRRPSSTRQNISPTRTALLKSLPAMTALRSVWNNWSPRNRRVEAAARSVYPRRKRRLDRLQRVRRRVQGRESALAQRLPSARQTDGAWELLSAEFKKPVVTLASGSTALDSRQWHRIELNFRRQQIAASIDGKPISIIKNSAYARNVCAGHRMGSRTVRQPARERMTLHFWTCKRSAPRAGRPAQCQAFKRKASPQHS